MNTTTIARLLPVLLLFTGNVSWAQDDDDLLLSLIPSIVTSVNNLSNAGAKRCAIPKQGRAENTRRPDQVIGNGTRQSCTSAAVVAAVKKGGIITFNCGARPVIIKMLKTAKIFNNAARKTIIDGGNKVTLDGMGKRRILYMNTCDSRQVWTTSHCQNQDHPRLTVQNLTFKNGNSKGEPKYKGGGAIWARGGQFKIVNSSFESNVCSNAGPDVGGAAVRVLSQFQERPVYVVNSTFGGSPSKGNICSNGGGLSSIGVSFNVINSVFSHNKAIGRGANPARPGSPGGGSGGAIYNDGNKFTLSICGTKINNNSAREGGGAVFFVSNNRTGRLNINRSHFSKNPSAGFETPGYPGIFYLGNGKPRITNSTIN